MEVFTFALLILEGFIKHLKVLRSMPQDVPYDSCGILLLAFRMVSPIIFPSLSRIITPSSVMSESSASWGFPKLM